MAAKLRILAKNIADDATITASPAMSLTNLGVGNLQDPKRGSIARSTSLTDQEIKLTWGANQTANVLVLCRRNFTDAATRRLYLYSDAAWTTGIYDSTALDEVDGSVLPSPFSLTELQFKGWLTSVLYFTEQTTIRSAKVVLSDGANADGYMEASRIMLGKYFETTYDPPQGGAALTPGSMSTQRRGDGGSLLSELRPPYRTLALDLFAIPDADYDDIVAIVQYLGMHRDCFVDLYPDDTGAKGFANRMQAKITDLGPFDPHTQGLHRLPIVFEEA